MQVYFRMSKQAKENVKRADKTVFIPKSPVEMTILTLPPFVKDAKCKCGKAAEYMLGDMSFICCDCIGKQIVNSNRMEKDEDISVPLTRPTISKVKFEWSVNRTRWYTVYGRALRPKNWDKFLMRLKEVILKDTVIMFEGEYDKDKKEMTIY